MYHSKLKFIWLIRGSKTNMFCEHCKIIGYPYMNAFELKELIKISKIIIFEKVFIILQLLSKKCKKIKKQNSKCLQICKISCF